MDKNTGKFFYRVSAVVKLTGAEIAFLLEHAERHYDGKCKNAALPGEGGFINGWRNSISKFKPYTIEELSKIKRSVEEYVSFGEGDTVCKILEMPIIRETPERRLLYLNLRTKFSIILRALREESNRVNATNSQLSFSLSQAKKLG